MLAGGGQAHLGGDLEGGYYVQPTLFKGHNKMRIFQEEIFGPVLAVTTFKAVSYTHLRAHETVLDLVCRLLLEKKKKKNQNNHYDTTA